MQSNNSIARSKTVEHTLNTRLEEIGWALFLMMIGCLWLLPENLVPSQAWLVGAGLIMLGINFARFFAGLSMSGFSVFLGVVALVAGIAGLLPMSFPVIPAAFIVLGASLLMRALFKHRE